MFLSNRKNKDKLFTPLCKKRINDIVGDIREKAKIEKKITPHTLRRTYATTWYYENNHDIKTLRDNMGHASIKTTIEYI